MDTKAEFLKLNIHIKYRCLKSGKNINKKISIYNIYWCEKDSSYIYTIKCPECENYHKIKIGINA